MLVGLIIMMVIQANPGAQDGMVEEQTAAAAVLLVVVPQI